MKAAAYFWIISSILAWWRVTVYLIEEAFGPGTTVVKFFPIFKTRTEQKRPLLAPGFGGPGVKREIPGLTYDFFSRNQGEGDRGYWKATFVVLTNTSQTVTYFLGDLIIWYRMVVAMAMLAGVRAVAERYKQEMSLSSY
jgi:hypothetical protein